MSVVLVRRRGCYAKDCRYAGKMGHQSHAVCKKSDCLDQGLAHRGDHRILAARAAEPETGREGES